MFLSIWVLKSWFCVCLILTLITAAGPHAGLKVLSMWTGHTEIQLCLQHPLPHPLPLLTCRGAARRPRRPVGVDTCLWSVIWQNRKEKEVGGWKFSIIRRFLSVRIMEFHKGSAHKTEKSLLGYFLLLLFQINISEIKWRAKSNFCFKQMPKNVLKEIYFNINSFTLNTSKTISSDITAKHNGLCFNKCCCW